jgi:hypothetical protein
LLIPESIIEYPPIGEVLIRAEKNFSAFSVSVRNIWSGKIVGMSDFY